MNTFDSETGGLEFIGFSGKKQSGKDTAAGIVKTLLADKYNIEVTHFATPLKNLLTDIYGIDPNLVWGSDEDKNTVTHIPNPNGGGNMTIRELLQFIGTDLFRNQLYCDTWSEAPFRKSYPENTVVLIPDCRFSNEVEAFKGRGLIIRLEREMDTTDVHPSETALDNYEFKYKYDNNGSVDDLAHFLWGVMRKEHLL